LGVNPVPPLPHHRTAADAPLQINFLDLPVEALYKYLEANDLIPRWDPSPWSEAPCEPREYLCPLDRERDLDLG
jgi:hypothetical protein